MRLYVRATEKNQLISVFRFTKPFVCDVTFLCRYCCWFPFHSFKISSGYQITWVNGYFKNRKSASLSYHAMMIESWCKLLFSKRVIDDAHSLKTNHYQWNGAKWIEAYIYNTTIMLNEIETILILIESNDFLYIKEKFLQIILSQWNNHFVALILK